MNCSSCEARHTCLLTIDPNSIACMEHLILESVPKAMESPCQTPSTPKFCPICGKPLKVVGTERFCNNVQCENRYIPMR